MFALNGKNALITGSTSGIGLAVARNYVENGAKVVISGHEPADDVAREIGATAKILDVTSGADYQKVLAEIEAEHGKLDILVLNAGIAGDVGFIEESPEEFFDKCIAVNLKGVYLGLKYGPRHMNDGGSIIVTGSAAGSGTTAPGSGEYSASKAGAAYLARTSALELAPRNIRVNVVAPASIYGTGMMDYAEDSPELALYRNLTAFERMGKVDELLGLYNFLAGEGSTFITGDEIRIDGGMCAGVTLGVAGRVME